MVREISCLTPLSRIAGQVVLGCPVCGISFSRPYAWVKRAGVSCCGRACAAKAREVRVETHCVSCGKSMSLIPSEVIRIVTCSKACSRIRRTLGKGFPSRKTGSSAYTHEAKAIAKAGECCSCQRTYGPWIVRGLEFKYEAGEATKVSDGVLWCQDCHMTDISPLGVEKRKIGIAASIEATKICEEKA